MEAPRLKRRKDQEAVSGVSEAGRKRKIGYRRNLGREVRELSVKLAIAKEALRLERERCRRAEKRLEEVEKRNEQLETEFQEVLRDLQSQMDQIRKMEELGKIATPALAHDLKNLLASIQSLAQLCIEKVDLVPPLDGHLQTIYESSLKANRLIKSFLDYAGIVKYDRLRYERLNIHDMLERMWNIARATTVAPRVFLTKRFSKKLPEVKGDKEKLERVFLNLFLNAIQAIPGRGRVMVETRHLASEKKIEIHVIDDGPGIPKKLRAKVFEPFFTTKEGGTGLGLSTCRAIVEQHGGTIRVASHQNRGTDISVQLPTSPERSKLA